MQELHFYDRVNFESIRHFHFYKARIDILLSNIDDVHSINEIIELYHVKSYIEEIDEIPIDILEKEKYKTFFSPICKKIGQYFSKITEDNFELLIYELDHHFVFDFWSIMCLHKRIHSITSVSFSNYLTHNPSHSLIILKQKDLAKKFASEIFQLLLTYPSYISSIISSLFEKKESNNTPLLIRSTFSASQLNTLYLAYINFEHPNTNTLKLLSISQNNPELGLDDRIRLLAHRKEAGLINDLMNSPQGIHYYQKYGVTFRDINGPTQTINEDDGTLLVYDLRWIIENTDYPTLLNNFIYLFEYADLQFRSFFPSSKSDASPIEQIFRVEGLNTYFDSTIFLIKRNLFSLQMGAYICELQKINIDIEIIFKWFFEEYLPKEFSIFGFTYSISTATTFLEKCKNISTEIEGILKKYRLYCRDGFIDEELFQMSSEHLVFKGIPSQVHNKYVYADSKRIEHLIHYLFNSSLLCCFEDSALNNYDNLYDAFCDLKKIDKGQFSSNHQQEQIQELMSSGVIIEENERYYLDKSKTEILLNFYRSEVLCYQHSAIYKDDIDAWLSSGDLRMEDTLFSIPEQQYLNYILNKSEYSNGLDLRNKYVHGTKPKTEVENYENYLEFLKIMVLVMIKINDELCLVNPLKPE